MKINILRALLILLIILTSSMIFGFSNQNAEQSSRVSKKITENITANIKSIQDKPKMEKQKIISKIENIIRKLAHFSIYTVEGFLLMALMLTYKINWINKASISLIIGIIYAISDEIHQAFIPGRGPLITDVIIDSLGVVLGILLITICIKAYNFSTFFLKKDKILEKKIVNDIIIL